MYRRLRTFSSVLSGLVTSSPTISPGLVGRGIVQARERMLARYVHFRQMEIRGTAETGEIVYCALHVQGLYMGDCR
jgi:hypothetical protein